MSESKYHVVLVDDNRDFLETVSMSLGGDFNVHTFTDPHMALSFSEHSPSDAIVLDYHIPGKDAHQTYQDFRMKMLPQPILFLTGDYDLDLKLGGLDMGVDDFLHKPISTAELSAHLKNRIKSYKKKHPPTFKMKNLEMKLDDPTVILDGRPVALTQKEFGILSLFVKNPNKVIKRMEMLERIWPDVKVEDNNVDTHLSNLRRKLRGFNCEIKTIKSLGYILRV